MKNKKSQANIVMAILSIFIILIVLAFILTFAQIFTATLFSSIRNTTTVSTTTETTMQGFEDKYQWDDKAFIVIYGILLLTSAFLASRVKYSNWWYIGVFFVIVICFFLGLLIEDLWESFKANASIAPYVSTIPVKDFMLSNPSIFIAVQLVIIFLVIYFQKWRPE